MNYRPIHDSIIERAWFRGNCGEYMERHHILPKSMGGGEGDDNVVMVTAREHYILHWILYRIFKNRPMIFAWYRMTHGKGSVGRYTSHTFSYAKVKRREAMSGPNNHFWRKTLSDTHREKMKNAKTGRTYADMGRGESPLLQ